MKSVFRADVVGSFSRPQELRDARDAFKAGRIRRDDLRRVEDRAILEALDRQRQAGMPIFSDGEFRRDAWQTDASDNIEGFVDQYPRQKHVQPDGTVVELQMHHKAVKGKLSQRRRLTESFVPFLKEHSPGPFKVTMPSPSGVSRRGFQPGLTDMVYATRADLRADLVRIYEDEMRALVEDGVPYVQFDEGFNSYVLEQWRENLRAQSLDPEQELIADIEAENACWDLLPPDRVTRASHLCRGSRTRAGGTGPYDWLAERLLNELHVDRFLFEYDTDRSGGFEPLRFLPRGKIVVLGIVSAKEPELESVDYLLQRIEEASKYCPVEQLAMSPQCGFGGAADTSFMTQEEQWRKLERVVEVSTRVWGSAATPGATP